MDVEMRREGEKGDASMDGEVCINWRGKPCNSSKHGGMKAAVFVLGIQAFEIMAIAAVGNNLITYVFNEMHFPLSKSANIVTNFVGTIFLLSLFGGFLSDSYLGSFWTMIIFGFVELSGFILLSVQAHLPQLRPPKCNMTSPQEHCVEANGFKSTMFFIALYSVALGSGCMKPNMIAHGADQFPKSDPKQSKKLSTYFNSAYFSFCAGELIALTVLVWVQTKSGMDVGFGMSAGAMAAGLVCLVAGAGFYRNKPLQGSIFTPVARVFVAAFLKRKQKICPSNSEVVQCTDNGVKSNAVPICTTRHSNKFRFLDKACIKAQDSRNEGPWRLCTVAQVEQTKILLSVIPIFACTIIFNTILAQLQTFSVQQGSSMNSNLSHSFQIPPASLQSIPYIMLIVLVPVYEVWIVPFMRRYTRKESGIDPLTRIGVGLFLVTFSMVAAACVERKRRDEAVGTGRIISIFWIAPQFLIFGLSEMFTAVGLIEFFYKQSLEGMQSFLTAMTYCSYSFGFFLSSVLVSLINKITSTSSNSGWLSNNDLNKDRLDLFYWLLAVLSLLNFFNYLFWARWYSKDASIGERSEAVSQKENVNGNGALV
ncbi:Protein NRT1/ PTR FAMILY 4.4 [Rhynchospora pubera]|uniref:Protein NRT1/ PTR FAMILY 4.4 n=1 Tax=Rhynchospora pubera TaxID=906938 RepID=A0AAV8FAK2_9POAL|nr:Protein NRT1/ PTR FAMILY 4.4 [Rhynchospora pubera]